MKLAEADIDAITNLPISAKAALQYNVSKNELIFDCKILPPCTSKVEPTGTVRRRKFFIECDGHGNFNIKDLITPEEQIEKIAKLKDKGILTEEEFERKKKEILERI